MAGTIVTQQRIGTRAQVDSVVIPLAELVFATDTNEWWCGTATGNQLVTRSDLTIVDVREEGLKGDGTDETTLMQSAIDKAVDQNGVLYVPVDMTITVDVGLIITFKENFYLDIQGVLKYKDSATFAGTRALLTISNCSSYRIFNFRGDGNVAQNGGTLKEHLNGLVISDCRNFYVDYFSFVNPPSDCIYLANNTSCYFGYVEGLGEDVGRNCVSIISGVDMQFNMIKSIGIGTSAMPGGFDIEPNTDTDNVRNVQINSAFIETQGTAGFSITNNFGATCEYVQASNIQVRKKTIDRAGGLNHTNIGIVVNKFNHVEISGMVTELQTTKSLLSTLGFWVNGATDVNINVDCNNVYKGAFLGADTYCYRCDIKTHIYRSHFRSIDSSLISDSVIDMVIEDWNYGEGTTVGAFLLGFGADQSNMLYKGKIIKKVFGDFGVFWGGGSIYDNVTLDIDFIGVTDANISNSNEGLVLLNVKPLIWHEMTLLNSWVSNGVDDVLSYAKDIHGNVHLKGIVTGGTTTPGTIIANNIFRGGRPEKNVVLTNWDGGSYVVRPTGDVVVNTTVGTNVGIGGYSYDT